MAAKASAIALGFGSSSADSSLGRAAAGEVGAAPDRVRPEDDGGSGLRAYLLAQYKAGHLSAKAVCDLSWHSSKAGAQNVHDLALNPDDHHQADHLRDCIHARSADSFFFADVPMWDKTKEERALVSFPMNLPHECFEWAVAASPQSHDVHRFSSADLPPQYWTHPVTLAGKKPTPVGYYSDGVPHTKSDSFWNFYWDNMLTCKRHLICTVRKSDCCKCGCKNMCTLGRIQKIIAWSFNVMAKGVHPSMDHMGDPFRDEIRWAKHGEPLAGGRTAALCEMRADLLEFVDACGFRRWDSVENPCFCCTCRRDDCFDFPMSVEACTWEPRSSNVYRKMVHDSVVEREVVTMEQLRELCSIMSFDTPHGGLSLAARCESLDLGIGHRLMERGPVKELTDVTSLELPARLSFIVPNAQASPKFVCPMFDVIGFDIEHLALDVMHVLDLGVTQFVIGAVFLQLCMNNFARSPAIHAETRRAHNIMHLRRRMWAFYKSQGKSRSAQSAIGKLTYKMLGPADKPRSKAKAAESRHVLPLCVQLCNECEGFLGGNSAHLKQSAIELCKVYDIMYEEPRTMSAEGLSNLRKHMIRHLTFWKAYGGHIVHKHHMAFHLVERAGVQGNPKHSWTYADEGENRHMGRVAKGLHGGCTFYVRFLQKVLPEVC